ncbi:MAG TPA: YlxM family DNA-binding protein [Thermaerobacter sp.]
MARDKGTGRGQGAGHGRLDRGGDRQAGGAGTGLPPAGEAVPAAAGAIPVAGPGAEPPAARPDARTRSGGDGDDGGDPLERSLRLHGLYDLYRGLLTPRQQDVFELYHWQDLSLGEVAEHLGISRQAVHDLLRRGEALLEEAEGALGLGAWRQRAAGQLERLAALLVDAAAQAGSGGGGGAARLVDRLEQALQVVDRLRRDLQAGPQRTGQAGRPGPGPGPGNRPAAGPRAGGRGPGNEQGEV